ncbi:MAG: aromatic-ring-hydroxylating dioxygenase subunit alpha, partial [Modestobacter sp.]|nr:aromatic-ring-hydroxylating dioxygenase subunit alpha [Modestobacter sp.]
VDAEAPEEFKALSYKAYLMCFGSTGMFEQDDVENWVSLTNTAAGSMARRLLLNSRMGILEDGTEVIPQLTPDQFHGPGSAHTGYSEYNQRELLTRWADHLDRPLRAASTVEVGGAEQVAATKPAVPPGAAAGTPVVADRTGAQA